MATVGARALSMGVDDVGLQSALIGNIIAHLADPANPAEQADKTVVHRPLNPNPGRGFDDTIIHDWGRGNDRGTGGLDRARLEAIPAAERGAAIQDLVYDAGRREPFLQTGKDGRPGVSIAWFEALYQVLLGQQKGPRFGGFIALYGVDETRALIERALAGELQGAAAE